MMTGYDDINNDDDLVDSDDTEDDTLGWWVRGQSSNQAGWVPGLTLAAGWNQLRRKVELKVLERVSFYRYIGSIRLNADFFIYS